MQHIEGWLVGRNLQQSPTCGGRLEGEALMYALTMYFVRREQLPEEMVVVLAEGYFSRLYPTGIAD